MKLHTCKLHGHAHHYVACDTCRHQYCPHYWRSCPGCTEQASRRGVWEDLDPSPRELFKEFCGGEA